MATATFFGKSEVETWVVGSVYFWWYEIITSCVAFKRNTAKKNPQRIWTLNDSI